MQNNIPKNLAPFSCSYSPNVPELLLNLKCSIAISTYQAGKVVMLSPKNAESLIQLPRTFAKPMGIALSEEGDKMAIACKDEIVVLKNSPELARFYPARPDTYDALYMPRATYHTSALDIHDLTWGGDGKLYGVNTLFSTIVSIDTDYNFTPYWQPPFITDMVSEDRCHLNGMAELNGKPKYATAFNKGNTAQSWREVVTTNGIMMDIEKNEIIAENLPMPHSPRIFNGDLYVLFSATGELAKINTERGTYEVITQIDGFVRGMAYHKEFLFIGLSRLRKNSSTFAKLSIADKSLNAGVAIIHLPTGSYYGEIKYQASVDEIYDIQILPNKIRPNILNTLKPEHKLGVSIPDKTFWARPQPGE